jgi:hypothetical protein
MLEDASMRTVTSVTSVAVMSSRSVPAAPAMTTALRFPVSRLETSGVEVIAPPPSF